MPYANINERRAKQKEQYQKKKIDYAKQDKKNKSINETVNFPVNYYNESNDRRNYGNGINKDDDDDSESETESEADDDSETDDDDEINDDELLTEYLVFLINYRDTKMNKYEKAINRKFKLIKCKNSNTYKIELY